MAAAAQLVVFDLDHTLLDARHRVSPLTLSVLERLNSLGVLLAASTGRSHSAVEHVLVNAPFVDLVTGSAGASVYTRSTVWAGQGLRQEHPFTSRQVRDLFASANAKVNDLCWAWDTVNGVVPDSAFRKFGTEEPHLLDEVICTPYVLEHDPRRPIDEQLALFGPVLRVLILHPGMTGAELHPQLLVDPGTAHLTRSSALFLEATAPGVDKRSALELLLAELGIDPVDVIAFGDSANDLGMLRWVGRGIAMSDGDEEVLRAISEHTRFGHDEDGVAHELRRIFGLD